MYAIRSYYVCQVADLLHQLEFFAVRLQQQFLQQLVVRLVRECRVDLFDCRADHHQVVAYLGACLRRQPRELGLELCLQVAVCLLVADPERITAAERGLPGDEGSRRDLDDAHAVLGREPGQPRGCAHEQQRKEFKEGLRKLLQDPPVQLWFADA